jgi:hypothetical protein
MRALTPAELLSRLTKTSPQMMELAQALSLAVRLEPALIREVRLTLWPGSRATVESDLFFSPLIVQTTPDWICLGPQFAQALQFAYSQKINRRGTEIENALRVRRIIERIHCTAPVEIQSEEEVIWMSVRQEGGKRKTQKAINEKLRELLMRMLEGTQESVDLARWFASASRRLPQGAVETEAFSQMVLAASSMLGGRPIDAVSKPNLETFDTVARYLPQSVRRARFWAGLTTRGLHFRTSAAEGYRAIDVPRTSPVLLEVRSGQAAPHLLQLTPGRPAFAAMRVDQQVTIRTLTRDLLQFRPKAASPAAQSSAQPPYAETTPDAARGSIFISYAHEDQRWRNEVSRVLSDVAQLDFWDDTRIPLGERWEDEIRKAVERSTVVIALVSPSYLASDLFKGEVESFIQGLSQGRRTFTWICVEACNWQQSSLARFQALHDPNEPLSELSSERRTQVLREVTRNLDLLLKPPHATQQRPIFISYRRDDSTYADRLYEQLRSRNYGAVINDVSLNPGESFLEAVERSINQAEVFIALIGPRWLSARSEDGKRRLDDPNDFVRLEIATALRQGLAVIPVLVGDAQMPRVTDLPSGIVQLANYNAVLLRESRWDQDFDLLTDAIASRITSGSGKASSSGAGKRVFVMGSTDVATEREAVFQAGSSLGLNMIRWEDFTSTNLAPNAQTAASLESADVAVLIVGSRYGFIPGDEKTNPDRISVTEQEFRTARRSGIPVLAFFLDEDKPNEKISRLLDSPTRQFRDKVSKEVVTETFRSPEDLAERFSRTVTLLFQTSSADSSGRFKFDIYISYAHEDDAVLIGRNGWVANLRRALEVRLGQLLGRPLKVWMNRELAGNAAFAGDDLIPLTQAAALVAVVSPFYVNSEWALRELEGFWKSAEQQGRVQALGKAPLFKVLKTPIPTDLQPDILKHFLGYEFYKIDLETGRVNEFDETFGPEALRDFWLKLDDLAHDIATLLER